GAARRRDGVVALVDVGDGAGELRQRHRVDVAAHAAADLVLAGDDVVAPRRRHHALDAVAELDLAGDRVAHEVARARPRVEEALDGAPAPPVTGVLAFALLAHRIVAEIGDVLRRRVVLLFDLDLLALEQRAVRKAERLDGRAVGRAQDLVAQRDDVGAL